MKKAMLFLAFTIVTMASFAQAKDTTAPKQIQQTDSVAIKITAGELQALLTAINSNVDSKKASQEILDFLQKKAVLLQPADKPKPKK